MDYESEVTSYKIGRWKIYTLKKDDNNFWKYAVPAFLVLALIYFISRSF